MLSYAQGFLRGKIIDGETGEGLIGATVMNQSTGTGAAADFDGNYSLSLSAGTHTVIFQFVSYQTQTVSDVVIKEGEVTKLDVTLSSSSTELEEVIVTAEAARNTESALLLVQKKSTNLVDGISTQTFTKLGDNDLGVAMKRVTGVSVQGGKYVYVRGLGDRYTKTTLNGMSIPGLDPDNNAVQIDIFPTNTIENVMVYKTFSPNLPGDFTGGLVDVEQKSFPDEKTTSFSLGVGYNPDMNMKSNFPTYDGGDTDFLGFDDGTRKLPFSKNTTIPDIASTDGALTEGYTRSFNPQLAVQKGMTSPLNYNFSFNHGNQLNKGDRTIGYNAVLTYRRTYEYYNDVQFGEYFKRSDLSRTDLQTSETRSGALGSDDVFWSALVSGAYKVPGHSISLNVLRSQNGISSASNRTKANVYDNPSLLREDILTYTQRSSTNALLIGKHSFDGLELEWRGSWTESRIYDPDYRTTSLHVRDDGNYDLQVGVGGGMTRFFRDMNETNKSFKVDATKSFGTNHKVKAGGMMLLKHRDFQVLDYDFRIRSDTTYYLTEDDPDAILVPENIWTPETNQGFYVRGNLDPSKTFESSQNIFGAYIMDEMQIFEKLKAIYGLRVEQVLMRYTGSNQSGSSINNLKTLDELDFLPSLNFVYSLNDEMNIRASANRTLARPTFMEKSNAQLYDPIQDRTRIGNLDLQETHIDNFDLRWEYFYGRGEMVSVSGFYKNFDGHIEWVSYVTAPKSLKPRNSGESKVYGVEIEFRKNLTNKISLGSNASLVQSAVDLKSVYVEDDDGSGDQQTEYELRKEVARTDESISSTRPMAGQSPYLINAFLGYRNTVGTFNANLAYNVQGETLNVVGSGRIADVYTRPFNSLNLVFTQSLGERKNSQIRVSAVNLLDAERANYYKSYHAQDEIFSIYKPGRTYSIKYTYTF